MTQETKDKIFEGLQLLSALSHEPSAPNSDNDSRPGLITRAQEWCLENYINVTKDLQPGNEVEYVKFVALGFNTAVCEDGFVWIKRDNQWVRDHQPTK